MVDRDDDLKIGMRTSARGCRGSVPAGLRPSVKKPAVGSSMLLPNEPRKKFVPSSSWRWIRVVARAGSLASSNSLSSILYFSPAISTPPSTSLK